MTTVREITNYFEKYYPMWMAEKNDPNGLHIGSFDAEVKKVMVTLDVRPNVVLEAIQNKVDLIIAKHPPIFRPISRLTDEDAQTKMFNDLIRNNINVYAAHTNIDIAPNGLNDWLFEEIGVEVENYLELVHKLPYEMFTIAPKNKKKQILDIVEQIEDVKILEIGEVIKGIVSPKNKENMVQLLYNNDLISNDSVIFQKLIDGPYEEYGIGRIGSLPKKMTLHDFTYLVKDKYKMDHVRLISKDLNKNVQKIAICSGSGQKFYETAKQKGADVYITGDVYYHTGHDMLESEMSVIDAGHYIEHLVKPNLVKIIKEWSNLNHWNIEVIESKVNTNPFRVY